MEMAERTTGQQSLQRVDRFPDFSDNPDPDGFAAVQRDRRDVAVLHGCRNGTDRWDSLKLSGIASLRFERCRQLCRGIGAAVRVVIHDDVLHLEDWALPYGNIP